MQAKEINAEVDKIRKQIDDLHASKPLTPEEKARVLQVLVYLRFRNEVIEL